MKKPGLKKLALKWRVRDRWYPEKGTGIVVAVLKTRARICWPDGEVTTYDQPHYQFLERARG